MLRITLFIICISISVFPQISPGDLSRAHSKFEGMSNCTKCHVLGDKVTNQKCLDCHSEIKELVSSARGYHGSRDVRGKECVDCHSEHHGLNFKLIRFDQNSFDHNKTGYPLSGKHSEVKCADCHNANNISNPKMKQHKGTYLGLNSECSSCHSDAHNKTLGSKCSSCHSTEGFKPAKLFDHNTAAFRLRDAHTRVDCAKCHLSLASNTKEKVIFSVAKFSKCSDCHKDVHSGKFGDNCTECHNTVSFNAVATTKFDHNKTNFPLAGAHVTVKCSDCHGNSLTSKPKHTLCTDCHKDFHKGQFVREGKVRDCSGCHSIDAFTPSLFTIEAHNKSRFQLTGRHLSVPCFSCHRKGEEFQFTGIKSRCIDCHENIHRDEIRSEFLPDQKCESCHNTEGWHDVKFDHAVTKFPLVGKHSIPKCAECHTNKDINSGVRFLFSSVKNNCINCHSDIHFGQFGNVSQECLKCHNYESWKPVLFNHTATRFPLTGAHEKVDCSKCHITIETVKGKYKKFKMEDYRCVACHS